MTEQAMEARIKELETRLARLERPTDRVTDEVDRLIRTVVPEDTRTHMRAAWREQLMAIRAFLDHWIESEHLQGERTTPRERIDVR